MNVLHIEDNPADVCLVEDLLDDADNEDFTLYTVGTMADAQGLLTGDSYLTTLMDKPYRTPSLGYGQRPATPGFHIMETPSAHWVETLTGLGATGVEVIVAYVGEHPLPSHPLVPVLQLTAEAAIQQRFGEDMDLHLTGDSDSWPEQILDRMIAIITDQSRPKLDRQGNIDFQITRGLLGVSL